MLISLEADVLCAHVVNSCRREWALFKTEAQVAEEEKTTEE